VGLRSRYVVLGRKRLGVPVENIIDGLRKRRSVVIVAQELGCSRGHIYDVLKAEGLKVRDVVEGNGEMPITPEEDPKAD